MQIPPLIPTLDRRAATDAAFARFTRRVERELHSYGRALAEGRVGVAEWGGMMLSALAQAHAEAGFHGRVRAGDTAPMDEDDRRFGALVAQEEERYLWAFQADVEGGRYTREDGTLDADAIGRRSALYVARLYGTANEALALVAEEEAWYWERGKTDSCRSCIQLEENSPYRDLPPTLPRMGRTECLNQCGCRVRGASGLVTFAPE